MRHRIAQEAQPVDTRRRVGSSRTPSGEVGAPRRSVACVAGSVFSGQSSRQCCHCERASSRPTQLSEAIPVEVSRYWPHHQFELDQEKYASNLRSAPALVKDNGGASEGSLRATLIAGGGAMAQQCALRFERACMPFQHALSTRAGTDCVARGQVSDGA